MLNITIFGAGGFANEVFDWIFSFSNHKVCCCYVDPPNPTRESYPAIYSDLTQIDKDFSFITAVGNPSVKEYFHMKAIEYGMKPCDPLFLNCVVGNSSKNKIDSNTIVCPYATITSNVTIGKGCTININSTIGHDCKVGDFVTIMPGANISGNVLLGNKVTVGCNACIKEKVTIADNVFIGMGAVVVKDILEAGVYVGNPIRKLK